MMRRGLTFEQIRKEWAAWMERRRAGDKRDIVWSDDRVNEQKRTT